MSKHSTTLEAFRDNSDEELRAQLATDRDELFRMQLGQYTNQVTSTAGLTAKRRDIARLMTILNGRAAGIEKQAEKKATAAEAAPTEKKTKKTSKKKAE
ncbi:MAG: 50S ribosomal protein L29 [Kofleriaceae bacterium]